MYNEFTHEQLVSGLKSLKLENADLLNKVKKLTKELKDIKGQCSSFEGDSLDRKTVARRFNVN